MSDMTEETDVKPGGIDRRSALKKAAVAGAVAWTVPTVLSSKVSAVGILDGGCTAKCAPDVATTSFTVTGSQGPCTGNPGQQQRIFNITSITVNANAACGCGGSASVTYTPQTLSYLDTIPNQGSRTVVIGSIVVTTTCADRQGNEIDLVCTASITATFQGSCQGNSAATFVVSALTGCFVRCLAN